MAHIDLGSLEGVTVPYPAVLVRTNRVLSAPDINPLVQDVLVGHCTFAPFSKSDIHTHEGIEMIYVLSGHGRCRVGEDEIELIPDPTKN